MRKKHYEGDELHEIMTNKGNVRTGVLASPGREKN